MSIGLTRSTAGKLKELIRARLDGANDTQDFSAARWSPTTIALLVCGAEVESGLYAAKVRLLRSDALIWEEFGDVWLTEADLDPLTPGAHYIGVAFGDYTVTPVSSSPITRPVYVCQVSYLKVEDLSTLIHYDSVKILQIGTNTGLNFDPITGGVKLYNNAATGGSWGVLSNTTQSIGGDKTFVSGLLTVDEGVDGVLQLGPDHGASGATTAGAKLFGEKGAGITNALFYVTVGGSEVTPTITRMALEQGVLNLTLSDGDSINYRTYYQVTNEFGGQKTGIWDDDLSGLEVCGGLITGGTIADPTEIDGGTW